MNVFAANEGEAKVDKNDVSIDLANHNAKLQIPMLL